MKIEVGKTYQTRDGKVAFITNKEGAGTYAYKGTCEGISFCWGENGNYAQYSEHPRDIVSIYWHPDSDRLTKTPEAPTITPKIGGVYLTRNGKEITVVDIEDDEESPVVTLTKKHKTRRYHSSGVYDLYDKSKFDIVAVVSEPLSELEIKNIKLNQIQDAIDGRPLNDNYPQCQEAMFVRNLKQKYDQAMSQLKLARSETR